jgi:hypothetical protein
MLGTLVLVVVDREARLHNQDRLRALSRDRTNKVRLFCSHDAIEFKVYKTGNLRTGGLSMSK